ncbi:MAG: DUF3179 domain-containing protein [Symploca sp. SIO2C1]|nr:DUF3179 domain-containing protein [Symploca sp. SIO2C1]
MTTTTTPFDSQRLLKQPEMFQRFDISDRGIPLKDSRLPASADLLVVERGGERRGFLRQEIAYHHVAQGELAGEPYIISFCGVCNSGVGITPVVEGKFYRFSAGGLYNGVVILTDEETGTYWNHMTGEAVYGPMTGTQLDTWGIEMTTVQAAMQAEPNLIILRSHQHRLEVWMMKRLQWLFGKFNFLPPFFVKTMAEVDPRLPEMTMGLGVVVGKEARFYPMSVIGDGITDNWQGQLLNIRIGEIDRVPSAVWGDGTRPLQLFLRWYGFVLTYPNCSLYQ